MKKIKRKRMDSKLIFLTLLIQLKNYKCGEHKKLQKLFEKAIKAYD